MNQDQSLPRAGAEAAGPQGAGAPKPIAIRLVTREADANCRFWVGLAARGGLSPVALMGERDVGGIFQKAAQGGIDEEPPILLTDTQLEPPRYVYLLTVPDDDFRARTIWTQELVRSLRTWAPKTIGFYLAPELLRPRQTDELLGAMLRELIDAAIVEEIFLFVGSHGVNALLNSALRLKAEVESELVNVLVYH